MKREERKKIMINKVNINGVEYYEHYINNNVGDIFTDWRDIPRYRAKLINQIKKSNENSKQIDL